MADEVEDVVGMMTAAHETPTTSHYRQEEAEDHTATVTGMEAVAVDMATVVTENDRTMEVGMKTPGLADDTDATHVERFGKAYRQLFG